VYGLPDDYFSTFVQAIQGATAADVRRVAQRYVQPDRMAVVVVGDRKVIEAPIRTLNLGAIRPMTIEEVFAAPLTRR
jgi:zinc protease